MPVRHAVWKVGQSPEQLSEASLTSEALLEDMIVSAPKILSDEWMLIGRQENTGYGGKIDLLALEPDGTTVLIELKRGLTPREVVAQALDYASWVQKLNSNELADIYRRFRPSRELATDFQSHFEQKLDPDSLNQSHKIVVVASSLDDRTERIIEYLNERQVPINVLFFQVFKFGAEQLLTRAWLIDPLQTQVNASSGSDSAKDPWNGEFYASFGHSTTRSWNEAVKFGFISAGGGAWYSNTLNLLDLGDRVWVKAPGYGFVGVGRVVEKAEPLKTFAISTNEGMKPAVDVLSEGSYHREFIDDPEKCEYFVRIKWLETKLIESAVDEIGLFGNQNTVCKPTTPKWRHTIERLKMLFPSYDEE